MDELSTYLEKSTLHTFGADAQESASGVQCVCTGAATCHGAGGKSHTAYNFTMRAAEGGKAAWLLGMPQLSGALPTG